MALSDALDLCILTLGLLLLRLVDCKQMTECQRGVKRPHPTQENGYQIYVRSDRISSWLDGFCPVLEVFDPDECICVLPPTQSIEHVTPSTPVVRQQWSPWNKTPGPSKSVQTFPPSPTVWTTFPVPIVADDMAVPIKNCKHHRPGQDAGHYEQWVDGGWLEVDCNWPVDSGLIWNQDLCRCDWGPNRQQARLRFNSVPAVCLLMLRMTFDEGVIKDESRNLWMDFLHPDRMEAVRDSTAVGGWSGSFKGAGLSIPFFKQNTLGETFRIKFRFKLCSGQPDSDLMLLNNGCVESTSLPSLQVTYRAWTRDLAIQMETLETVGPIREECQVLSQDQWIDVNIHYDKNILEVFVNGAQCVKSSSYIGPIKSTDCPLTLLEDNFCGKMDEIVITRGCTPQQE